MATVTRRDLTEAVYGEAGFVRRDAAEPVDGFIEAIAERLSAGEEVKISSSAVSRCATRACVWAAIPRPASRR